MVSQALLLPQSEGQNVMAQCTSHSYTSVSKRPTFGLLHPCKISSIVSISASTLVPRFVTGRKTLTAAGFSAKGSSGEALDSIVHLFQCTSFFRCFFITQAARTRS